MNTSLNAKSLAPIVLGALILGLVPPPAGLNLAGWQMLVILILTIGSVVVKVYPLTTAAILGLTAATIINAIDVKTMLSGFSSTVTWLVVMAFVIARAIIKTGLGRRIAFFFIYLLGKRTLTLSYGLAMADLVLAPAMPSITARGGGVIAPIVRSIAAAYGSEPNDGTGDKIGKYLTFTAFIVNITTASMFVTAMAGNPLAVAAAKSVGIDISWNMWALAASVPGLITLAVAPLVVYFFVQPPQIKRTPEAVEMARKELAAMGPFSLPEWIVAAVFVLLLALWILGDMYKFMDPTVGAFVGCSLLLLTGIITVEDMRTEKEAWETFVWMSILITLGGALHQTGATKWMALVVAPSVEGLNPALVFTILILAYFYTHYFFASASAHVAAMFAAFIAVGVKAGVSGVLLALAMGPISSLMAAITHYGIGSAPIFFGSGYLSVGQWWRNGLLMSIVILLIWLIIGPIWWGLLGY
jgi:DASS family divalent anion:Na+ symporter